jgi:HPt (histidine-containing phosphotransfer) domain-containing protein
VLATLLDLAQRDGLGQLDDDQLTGVLQAAHRLAAWSASLKLAATSRLAARREAEGRKSGDWRPFDHVDDEVAVALTLTRRSAGRLLDLALSLDRLPLTRAALAAGRIDERRAEVITEELSGLDDAHAAAVEKLIIGKAPGLTTGQLRALARRAVLSADPAAARQRKEQALRDARVEAFTEHAGTAGLAGRDLCPVDVLAADQYLTALAQAMKAAGITGTLDVLRAHAYLHLLSGQPASTLLDPAPRTTTPRGTAPGGTSPGCPAP